MQDGAPPEQRTQIWALADPEPAAQGTAVPKATPGTGITNLSSKEPVSAGIKKCPGGTGPSKQLEGEKCE